MKSAEKIDVKKLMKKLFESGIGTRPFFWPMHKQPVFLKMRYFENCIYKNSEFISANGFYIPLSNNLTENQQINIHSLLLKILN